MFNIIVFMGPSGSGKSKLQRLFGYKSVVTWTSREPRPGEVDGKDYHFTNKDNILNMYKEGLLIEYTEYNGNIYGTGINSIKKLINTNSLGSIVLDANGVRKIKNMFTEKVLIIGVIAPYEECKDHLINRDDKYIEKRLASYSEEINSVIELSDIVINNAESNWAKNHSIIQVLNVGIKDLP